MSAILGRVSLDGRQVSRRNFIKAFDTLQDWGRDGRGLLVQGAVALGHQNLALTLVSGNERQPLCLGRQYIVSDAVIDNRAELCELLEIDSILAGEIPDSQLILRAYQRWGEASVDRLVGDFAFVIWDSETSRLFAARDVAGSRPLFYAQRACTLLFGTTVESIVAHPDIQFDIDESRVAFFLAQPFGAYENPFIEGIEFLPPGHTLLASTHGINVRRYWHPEEIPPASSASLDDYAEQLRSLVERAIEDRLCQNHPVGSHISGGLDSTGISVLAHRLLRNNGSRLDMSYAWAPPICDLYPLVEKAFDERFQIADLSKREGFDCVFGSASSDDYMSFLKRNIAFENSTDLFEELPLMEQAAGRKTRVMLSGWGGDECVTFGLRGYPSWLLGQRRFKDLFNLARTCGGGLRKPIGVSKFIFQLGILPLCSDKVYSAFSPYLKTRQLLRLSAPALMARYPDAYKKTSLIWRDAKDPFSMQCALLKNGHLSARMSLWSTWAGPLGIQYRYPLLDKRLIEYSLSLPPDMLWQKRSDRIVYREAMRDVLPKRVSKYDTANEEKRKKISFYCWKKLKSDVSVYREIHCPWLDMEALVKRIEEAPVAIEDFDLLSFIPLHYGMRVLELWRQGMHESGDYKGKGFDKIGDRGRYENRY
ncbi:asparagine synthetase B family protein [Halomonas saccharevitans]|uniref:asparagine synthase (glutamine-hydrolyzing) n=1 Tax=Halomonas saccharevitans TaxID=416872 RepID=A0A1I7BDZ1_9GAMM|nr:asparagine synthase-related protein [Halomonas saccharevitans]SFT85446.1 asparagine synthase (glutamine-hydrolysing) [Halomonas saccharevitans]